MVHFDTVGGVVHYPALIPAGILQHGGKAAMLRLFPNRAASWRSAPDPPPYVSWGCGLATYRLSMWPLGPSLGRLGAVCWPCWTELRAVCWHPTHPCHPQGRSAVHNIPGWKTRNINSRWVVPCQPRLQLPNCSLSRGWFWSASSWKGSTFNLGNAAELHGFLRDGPGCWVWRDAQSYNPIPAIPTCQPWCRYLKIKWYVDIMFRRQSYTSYPLMRKTRQRDLKGSLALPLRCWGDTQAWVFKERFVQFCTSSILQ